MTRHPSLPIVALLLGACSSGANPPRDAGSSDDRVPAAQTDTATAGDAPADGAPAADLAPASDRGAADAPDAAPDVPPGDVSTSTDAAAATGPPSGLLFEPLRYYPTGNAPYSHPEAIALGDLDSDGRRDVAVVTARGNIVGGANPQVHILLQTANGALGAPTHLEPPVNMYSTELNLLIADVNHDRRDDLVVSHSWGLVTYLQSAGSGFAPPQPLDTYPSDMSGRRPTVMAAGSIDGDDLLDVIAATNGSQLDPTTYLDVLLFSQRPTGGLAAAMPIAVSRSWHDDLAVGDLDGNGLTDIAVANDSLSSHALGVLLQTAPGTWGQPAPYDLPSSRSLYTRIGIGDVTGDGKNDLLAAYGNDVGWVAVLAQETGGKLGRVTLFAAERAPTGMCVVDVDGDGHKDVVLSHGTGVVGVLLQRAGGGLQAEDLYLAPGYTATRPLACGDVDGDGRIDVVVAEDHGVEVLHGTGITTLAACGAAGQRCCAGRSCGATATCNDPELCVACGGPGQPCCAGETCTAGATCNRSGVVHRCTCPQAGQPCSSCGGAGQACCDGDRCQGGGCCVAGACVTDGHRCGGGLAQAGTCHAGRCDGCGGPGQSCCKIDVGSSFVNQGRCDDPSTACVAHGSLRLCEACGAPGQPCCQGNRCGPDGCCDRAEANSTQILCRPAGTACLGGATCTQGSCGTCGGPGQPCCGGRCTAAATACGPPPSGTEYICRPCGAQGQPCCTNGCTQPFVCSNGTCF